MWEGVPRTNNPAFTECGLNKCKPCKAKNSRKLAPRTNQKKRTIKSEPKKCFKWNNKMWEGIPRTNNPAFTECGLDKCVPCIKKNSPKPAPRKNQTKKPIKAAPT